MSTVVKPRNLVPTKLTYFKVAQFTMCSSVLCLCSTVPVSAAGIRCDLVGTTRLPYGQVPVLLHNGEVTLQTQSGKLVTIALDSHSYLFIDAIDGKTMKEVCVGLSLSAFTSTLFS